MKHLLIIIIVVSLCVFLLSIGVYHKVPWSVLPIVASGICILCWLLFHLLCISEERDLLKEGNQYFIDTFQNIRNPISLIKTPLGAVYEGDCPEDIKKELAVALHHIGGLEQHLIALMELKRLFGNSGSLVVAEHEIGAFMRKKVSFLQSHVAGLQMKLDLVPDFDYASAWFDPGKISPVIDRFVLSAIECSLPETHLSMQVSLKGDYWAIRIKDTGNKRFLKCCRWYSSRLPILRPLHGKQYGMGGVFFDKLMNMCDGKILTLEKEALLRFPIRCSCAVSGGYTSLNIPDTFQVNESEIAFHGFSKKKNMDRPLVILADNDKGFKDYLEKRLSECFVVRSFDDGQEALEVICEEYPDLVICDIMLKGMSGEELSSKLKTSRDTSFIPVILMGAHIDVKRREKRCSSQADLFVCKPFNLEDLKVEISILINNSRFLRKTFLQKVFGEDFLTKPMERAQQDANLAFLNEVKLYIMENMDKEDLTVDDIASRMCMSRTTFYNKWKLLTGEAPKYLISRIRMEKARELLESGKFSVTVVAEMVGMRNLKNFRGRYKEYFGKTPKEFMKKV
ncbi:MULTISPECIES: hybrid sensor histidine kinase/response regulator transcription factor [Bacteroidaceae]|uniref:Response regulator transcription factor n=2 Tax=Bacteroidaceae TaxID=815 RepID=A0A5M5ZN42_9BACT|nr:MULTISPECIES: response regulator [Bacteroidaceae]KAA5378868.1 response regulator transcription factor [Phocaeicola dorei]KAB4248662.1 response regulator transcription factor [Bacteroides uniformis]KAB4251523.1 response regulator transcription factor [Bacteroides uniformis]KAB4255376.1 response regulator transcription factor [Bacteroides uniformis]KAB4261212.1 response regulator transcription factor [Bacteroides uniformis]